jgi:hypothetical protein
VLVTFNLNSYGQNEVNLSFIYIPNGFQHSNDSVRITFFQLTSLADSAGRIENTVTIEYEIQQSKDSLTKDVIKDEKSYQLIHEMQQQLCGHKFVGGYNSSARYSDKYDLVTGGWVITFQAPISDNNCQIHQLKAAQIESALDKQFRIRRDDKLMIKIHNLANEILRNILKM